jgi:hypothetical protein
MTIIKIFLVTNPIRSPMTKLYKIDVELFTQYFESFGPLEECLIMTDKLNGKCILLTNSTNHLDSFR